MTTKAKKRKHFLVSAQNARSAVAEAYRTLRTNMSFTEMDSPCRTILVTSSHPQEGKSTTAANLAVVMAQAGQKVLLVDCDLRKPLQHQIFNLTNKSGLTNCLCHKAGIADAVHQNVTENLSILTSGPLPPNPSEMLSAEHTASFWESLKERYDYIYIDSPPLLAVADAAILSSQVDGVILVVNSGTTRVEDAHEAKEQLIKASAHIIGVVLNQVKTKEEKYSYYYNEDAS